MGYTYGFQEGADSGHDEFVGVDHPSSLAAEDEVGVETALEALGDLLHDVMREVVGVHAKKLHLQALVKRSSRACLTVSVR